MTIGGITDFSSIAMFVEKSSRGDKLARSFLDGYGFFEDNGKVEIPMYKFFMDKKMSNPGLEVADFIMHAAGTYTRENRNGNKLSNRRKDFQVTFCDVDPKLTSYMQISKVEMHK